MATIYVKPTASVAGEAGDRDTANDHAFCAENDRLVRAMAEADGHQLVALEEYEWGEHQAANHITDARTWEEVYADEYSFWLA